MVISTGGDPMPGGAPSGTPPATLARIAELQDDLLVLVEHLANRADSLSPARPDQPVSQEVGRAAGLLTMSPAAIIQDANRFGQLYSSLAALTALAAPAHVRSIRLTRAFVHGPTRGSLPDEVSSEARRLLRWAWASAGCGVLTFLCAIVLLVHVDRGRRAVQQLEQVQAEYQAIAANLTVAHVASSSGDPAGASMLDCADGEAPAQPDTLRTRQERLLCASQRTNLVRMRIVRRELAVWNGISSRLSFVSPTAWLSSAKDSVGDLSDGDWQSSELRTTVMMAALTGFIMPMLLGLLGACVYVYREIDNQIRMATLEARESVHGTLRMLLGAILGGMLGAIWTNGQSVRLEGVSLSLGALAFFVGFSVEIVFSMVDGLVRAVVGRVGNRPP